MPGGAAVRGKVRLAPGEQVRASHEPELSIRAEIARNDLHHVPQRQADENASR